MLALISVAVATSFFSPKPLAGYEPIKGAFGKVANSIKTAESVTPLTFYRGTALVGGVFKQNGRLAYTIAPGADGNMMAYVGIDGNDTEFKMDVTCDGQSVLSDSNEYGGTFSVQGGKRYTISVTNKGGQSYIGMALMSIGTDGSKHASGGIMNTVNKMSDAIGEALKSGYKVPVGVDSLIGGVLNASPQHKELSRGLLNGTNWIAMATCDGKSGDLSMTVFDSKKNAVEQNLNTDDVSASAFDKALPGGSLKLSSPTNKNILAASVILVKN